MQEEQHNLLFYYKTNQHLLTNLKTEYFEGLTLENRYKINQDEINFINDYIEDWYEQDIK